MEIRAFEAGDEAAVIELWKQCGLLTPLNNPYADIQRKLAVDPELFLVGIHEGKVVASVMAGYDGHRGWINYLAVSPDLQKGGYGRQIMAAAEALLRARGCPKINLQVRTTNQQVIEFYQRVGFQEDAVLSMGKRLSFDEPYEG